MSEIDVQLDAAADLLRRQREIVDRKTLKPFTKRSDLPGLVHFLGTWAVLLVTGYLIYLATPHGWWIWPAMALHGIVMGHLFAALHETSHGTAFRTRWINETVLWISGFVTIWPPIYFRYDHAGHHTYAQEPGKDPEHILPAPRSFVEYLSWISAIDIWTRNLGWILRHASGRMHPFNRQFVPEDQLPKIYLEARLMLLVYGALLVGSIYFQTWVVAIYWLIPTILGAPIARMIRLSDHVGCVEEPDLRKSARTLHTDPITRFFCWNMNYHCEHHLAPSVPFHQLKAFHDLIGDELNPTDKGYIAVQWEVVTQHLSGFFPSKKRIEPKTSHMTPPPAE